MAQGERYQVIVTLPAESRYRYTLLPYLLRNFSIDRAVEIETNLFSRVQSLASLPHRGTVERTLQGAGPTIRFILHRETRHFELKILYYVDEHTSTVFVVDYFPTAMHPRRMTGGK
jgi:plasmid stabilization system protein ParE